jgi:transcriptional regulator with XRE-family HTH domain
MPVKKPKIRQAEVVQAFAARLRDLRTARGMTQVELARAAHVTVSYVRRLEAGTSAPGIDLVARLAAALGTNMSDLLPEAAPAQDQLEVMQTRARAIFESLISIADRDTLALLNPFMARLMEAPRRRR